MSTSTNGAIDTLSKALPGDRLIPRDEALAQKRWVPGEPGIWALILTDLSGFTVYFIATMRAWRDHPDQFAAGRGALNLNIGILNTFFLLTASLLVALGVHHLRHGKTGLTHRLFTGAGLCGGAFMVTKAFEWGGKVAAGHTPFTDVFFQLYFILTGIHLAHVVIATILIRFMRLRVREINEINGGVANLKQARFIENSASYWHMVDLLWLVILVLFYLMG
jgi:nitric oxide reductase NorE protein